jgi:ABC-2 type transport system ATP-binding protein
LVEMTAPAILVEDLAKRFGDVEALCGVSLEVPAATVLGLLGPNGAGKTTAVRIMTTLLRPDSGRAQVLGVDVTADPERVRASIGLAGQNAAIDENLTGRENLRLVGRLTHLDTDVISSRSDDLLSRFDLDHAADRLARTYSGGMRRRLDLAAALVHRPTVLFLDEPTTGLDPAARRSLWDLITDLKGRGRTILLTTHYLEEAEILCDRLAIMDHGRILEMGTVDELISKRFKERAVRFATMDGVPDSELAALPAVTSVKRDDEATFLYTSDVSATIGALLALTEARGTEPKDLGVRRATLEDVFLDLTGRALRD